MNSKVKRQAIFSFSLCLRCICILFAVLALQISVEPAGAQKAASNQRTQAAVGHYARARSLLVEALAEFEAGRRAARPDLLIDPEEWRISIISRTEELNRVLDPQPRVTSSGVRFKAGDHLIRRDSRIRSNGARTSSNFGEEQRERERRAAELFTTPPSTQGEPIKKHQDRSDRETVNEKKNDFDIEKFLDEYEVDNPTKNKPIAKLDSQGIAGSENELSSTPDAILNPEKSLKKSTIGGERKSAMEPEAIRKLISERIERIKRDSGKLKEEVVTEPEGESRSSPDVPAEG